MAAPHKQTTANYMGFLFTLTSLAVSLYQFSAADSAEQIVRRDGSGVRLYTRNANDLTARLQAIAAAAERIKGQELHDRR
jgi:hypothetical protein